MLIFFLYDMCVYIKIERARCVIYFWLGEKLRDWRTREEIHLAVCYTTNKYVVVGLWLQVSLPHTVCSPTWTLDKCSHHKLNLSISIHLRYINSTTSFVFWSLVKLTKLLHNFKVIIDVLINPKRLGQLSCKWLEGSAWGLEPSP